MILPGLVCPKCENKRSSNGATFGPRKVWNPEGMEGFSRTLSPESLPILDSLPVESPYVARFLRVSCPNPKCGFSPLSGLYTERVSHEPHLTQRFYPPSDVPLPDFWGGFPSDSYVESCGFIPDSCAEESVFEVCHVCHGRGFMVAYSAQNVAMPRERETIPFAGLRNER